MDDRIRDGAALLQALAETNRMRLVELLASGERNVTELADAMNAKIVNVSHHLSVLKVKGVVREDKRGRHVYYSLNPDLVVSNNGHLTLSLKWCTLSIDSSPGNLTDETKE